MKKITLLTALFVALTGFSQSNRQKIQSYLDANRAKHDLTTQDVSDWVIESEVQGSGTGITSTYIVQRYQGIEIFNAQNNVWVKNGKVLNMPDNNFKSNIASKVNSTAPSLTVLQAVSLAYKETGVLKKLNFTVVESKNNKSFKLSDGQQENEIAAKLVYHTTKNNNLQLVWDFQYYGIDGYAWDIKIDAVNGNIIDKINLTISCEFDNHTELDNQNNQKFSFEKNFYKANLKPIVAVPGTPGTYRVIPFNFISPNDSPFQLITTTGNLLASPNGWHDANTEVGTTAALRYNYTRGNNVWAKTDEINDDGAIPSPNVDGGLSRLFDFPYDNGIGQTQLPSTYRNAATTNLFYMNNIMHDVWYQYGFTESAGNFQRKNLGRGGVITTVGDAVNADAQDGINNAKTNPPFTAANKQNRNNANFATLADGSPPRMQMYMWDSGAPAVNYFTVNSPSAIAGPVVAKDNSFIGADHVPVPAAPGITSNLVLYTNIPVRPTQNNNSACAPATNPFDLSGKIALIRRGGCYFVNKVKAAQDAGAVAAIIMDSIPQSSTYIGTLGMASAGTTLLGITIPAISITKDAGEILVNQMSIGDVNITLQTPGNVYLYSDGSFDNGIISHEYGHGISNRLIGGPLNASCMTNLEQMGEGWSDWFSLMMQIKTGDLGADKKAIGNFAINQPSNGDGIRIYPYTTDMALNLSTLSRTNVAADAGGAYKYTIGETWATVMWDLTWAYIGKYGFDADIYNGIGGNNKVMRLALDALKLQTCNTASMITSRDLLFAADQATTGGQDYCLIAGVFARRGMGLNASSGDVNVTTDQVEDFTPFPNGPNCVLSNTNFSDPSIFKIYPNPAKGSLNLQIGQYVGKLNIQFVDINGRIITNINDDNFDTQKTIDVSNLETGMYFVKVSADNINFTQKVLIK
jgi:extracellular elastinolytic metalloproteinase